MDNARILRLADSVALVEYPRLELRDTVNVSSNSQDTEIKVWIVDGEYIRTYIDEEWTNFGQHYRFSFIPENEFWLDQEAVNDESHYYIEHLKVEWLMMRNGKSYSEAIVEADRVEKNIRRKDGDIRQVIDPIRKIVDPKLFRTKLIKTLENGVKVWVVNGRLVRSVLNIDFTAGGHEFVYSWVPPMDVWIDNDIAWQERGLVILHELNERKLMEQGWSYFKAHENSSALELRCRKQIDDLQEELGKVGWS
jgi:hypothetical protein